MSERITADGGSTLELQIVENESAVRETGKRGIQIYYVEGIGFRSKRFGAEPEDLGGGGGTETGDTYFDDDDKAIFGKSRSETDQDYLQIYSDKTNGLQVLDSTKDGAGTVRPLSFQAGGVECARFLPTGEFVFGAAALTGAEKFKVVGDALFSDDTTFLDNVSITGGGSLTVSGGGQINANTLSVLVATNTMTFLSGGGAFSFDAGLTIAGALAGVTSLSMSGALSGVTTLAMGGALSGVTSLAMSGALASATSITLTGTSSYYDAPDGTVSAVAPANHGRLIYNNTTKTWQISVDGGAYASLSTGGGGGGTLDAAYDFGGVGLGAVIGVDGGPVAFTGSGTPATPGHVLVDGSQTIASGASATWRAVRFAPTVTLTGSTNVTTASGFNMVELAGPSITDSSAVTITNAATFTVLDAPTAAGSVTITNKYAVWVQAGQTMLNAATAGLPALCFGDKTTGLYRVAADTIGISCAGNLGVQIAANGMQINASAVGMVLTMFTNNVGRLIRGEPASNSNDGILTLGVANTQISLCTNTNSYGSGKGVILVGNAGTDPTTNPTGGGLLYSSGGAGKWRGSSGTVTTFGPAEPHCAVCGTDFGHEWENTKKYGRLQFCVNCLADHLAKDFGGKLPAWIQRSKEKRAA